MSTLESHTGRASPLRGELGRFIVIAVGAFGLACGAACAPKVKCLRVVPHPAPSPAASPWCQELPPRMCSGGLVDVSWEVKGSAILFSNPPTAARCASVPGDGRVAAKGTTTCQVSATTRLTIRAGPSLTVPVWWKYNEGIREVTVGPVPAPLGKQASCASARYEAIVPRDPRQWDADFKVLTVSVAGDLLDRLAAQPGLELRVAHAGLEDTLGAAKASTDKFRCAPYGGDWTLTLPESPGRACAEDPVFLTVQVATACGPCSRTP